MQADGNSGPEDKKKIDSKARRRNVKSGPEEEPIMSNKTTDPRPPDKNHDVPDAPHDPIEHDPINRGPVPPNTEPKISERPDLDWAEHED